MADVLGPPRRDRPHARCSRAEVESLYAGLHMYRHSGLVIWIGNQHADRRSLHVRQRAVSDAQANQNCERGRVRHGRVACCTGAKN